MYCPNVITLSGLDCNALCLPDGSVVGRTRVPVVQDRAVVSAAADAGVGGVPVLI